MDLKEAIKEFLEFEPKLLGDAADKIVEAIKVFQDSESEIAVQLRKAEQAKAISASLRNLREQAVELVTKIECEVAVIEAQKIINQ